MIVAVIALFTFLLLLIILFLVVLSSPSSTSTEIRAFDRDFLVNFTITQLLRQCLPCYYTLQASDVRRFIVISGDSVRV